MSKVKPCSQTSLATDNTPLECEEFVYTTCVVHPDALIELGLPENSTAQTIFNALLNAIINLNNQLGNTGTVTGMEIQDDGSIVINEALKLNFTDNLTAVVDGSDSDKVNVSATIPNYTIAIDGSNMLSILQDGIIVNTVDLSPYLDNTNLPQTVSAAIVGTDMIFTRDDLTTYSVDIAGLINSTASPIVISGAVVGTDIVLTKDDASTVTIDASTLLDDTNLSRIVSAEVVGTELVFTREDASMFMTDVSSLLDNVNFSRVVSGVISSTDLILTRDDSSTVSIDLSSLFQNAAQVPFTPTATVTEMNVQAAIEQLDGLKEGDLGLPATDGFILSSTTSGIRTWISPPSGSGGINSIIGGSGIIIDNTNVNSPIVNAEGLEIVNEGGNIGWRLIGQSALNRGDIGSNAIDMTTNSTVTFPNSGATGTFSFAVGADTSASGLGSVSMGVGNISSGSYSTSFGFNAFSSGLASFSAGQELVSKSYSEAVVGSFNVNKTPSSTIFHNIADDAFVVGIGNSTGNRQNGFEVTKNGLTIAPELTTGKIDSADSKVLVTKEWVQANSGGATNLTFNAVTSEIESDSGTNAIISLADASNSGLLSHYEEGTWVVTATDSAGGAIYTIGSEFSKYTRIGNLVTFTINLSNINTSGTPTGDFRISLPFSVIGTSALAVSRVFGSNVNFYSIVGNANNSSSFITFDIQQALDGSISGLGSTLSAVTWTNGRIFVSGSFFVV